MKKITISIFTVIMMISMAFSSSVFAANTNDTQKSVWDSLMGLFNTSAVTTVGAEYRGHIQDYGNSPTDGSWVQSDNQLGTTGESRRIEGFNIQLTGALPEGSHIRYNVHIQNQGWTNDPTNIMDTSAWAEDGDFAGSVGLSQRVEAIEIVVVNDNGVALNDYSVQYMVHIQNIGWAQGWKTDGVIAGTEGDSLRLEAIRINVVQKTANLSGYNSVLAAVNEADYTPASWAAYQAVVDANVVTADSLISQVDAATAIIVAAQDQLLVLIPKVTSVTAINAQQVVVTFNTAVNADDAVDTYNYDFVLQGFMVAGDADNGIDTAVLSADAKSVLLTLDGIVANEAVGIVTVYGDSIATAANEELYIAYYSSTVMFNDVVAPTLVSVTSITNGDTADTATLTFSEPIESSVIKIDGVKVDVAAWTVNNTVATVAGLELDAATTHTATVINATDYAGNVADTLTETFSVTTDTSAPTVDVAANSDKAILLTFDKALATNDATALVAAGEIKTNLIIRDEALAILDSAFTVVPLDNDTTYTKYVVTLSDEAAATLYDDQSSRTLTLVFADDVITDTIGNTLVGVNKTVTLTEDTTAPTITGITTENNTDGTLESLTITSSKDIGADFPANVTVVTSNGVLVDFDTLVYTDGDIVGNTVTYDALTDIAGVYNFTLSKGFVTDTSIAANESAAYAATVDLGSATAVTTFDVTSATGADVSDNDENVITVTFPEAVKGGSVSGSATLAANYTLNGSALPAGTTITLESTQKIATITIPAQTITTTDEASTLYIKDIKNLDGSKVVKTVTKLVKVYDNVSPVLQSAQLLADGTTFVLTYNENMDTEMVDTNIATGFTFTENGTIVTVTDAVVANVAGKTVIVEDAARTGIVPVAAIAAITGTNADLVTAGSLGAATNSDQIDYTVVSGVIMNGATEVVTLVDGGATFTQGNVLFTVAGAVDDDAFSVATTAATTEVGSVPFNTAKVVTLKTTDADVVEDVASNDQKADITVTTTR